MRRGVILLGAGGHGSVVLDCLLEAGRDVIGIIDLVQPAWTGSIPFLGDDSHLEARALGDVLLANGLGSVSRPTKRMSIFSKWKQRGFEFATLVHPRAVVAASAELAEGAQVMAGAVVQPHARIGSNVIVNTSASVDHHCVIEDHVHLAPGVVLSGTVSVGSGTHVGTGVRVIQNVRIGANCVVGAGITVLGDIPDNTVVSAASRLVWS